VSEGTELDVVDAEVEDIPGTDLAIPGETGVEEVVEGVIEPEDAEPGEILVEDVGVAYPSHGPVTSDVSLDATNGEGFSGAGFRAPWQRTGGGPGGGGISSRRRRRGQRGGGSGSGGGFHFSLIGAIFPNAALIKTGAIASNNASGNAPSVISTGRPARKPRPRRK